MSNLTFKPATRQGVKPLIGLFGKSGGGKTFSGLLLARGIVGPSGKIAMICTENGRGAIFCDQVPGGYDVLELNPPFSPEAYASAMDAAEAAGYSVLLVDSMSHEWSGEGGYLDQKEAALDRMAGQDWRKRDACKFAAAAQCKPAHNKLVSKIVRSKMAMILCFRGKDKVRMEKKEGEKTKVVADDHSSPIQDGDFIFEMLIAGEVTTKEGTSDGGYMRITKHTHPALMDCLPRAGEQISTKHGELIALWCNSPVSGPQKPSVNQLKKRINDRALPHYGNDGKLNVPALEQWLKDMKAMQASECLAALSFERLQTVTEYVENNLEAKF